MDVFEGKALRPMLIGKEGRPFDSEMCIRDRYIYHQAKEKDGVIS